MAYKFNDVPVEADTIVLSSREVRVGDRDALFQEWDWDGVMGSSLVFPASEVAGLTQAQLEALARQSGLVETGSRLSVSEGCSGFTFVSFNFRG